MNPLAGETSVLIAGAGPVGLLTALLLARAGVPCVVFEQNAGLSTHPKAMGITRRSAEIFRELGLLEAMRKCDFSTPQTQLMIWADSLCGEEYGRAPLPPPETEDSPCAPFHSPQPHTESVLFAAVQAEPLAHVLFNHRVTAVTDHPNRIEVEVEGCGATRRWAAEWLVAADGASSPIRRMSGVQAEGPGDLGHFLNVYFQADPGRALRGRESLLYTILRRDLVEFMVSVNGRDLWLMHHFLEAGDSPASYPTARLADLARSAAGLPDLQVNILSVAQWVMSPKVASRFRCGRTFFTGDAAARLSPAGGRGLNNGLQSAHNLAWKLAAVLRGQAKTSLLDSYEAERRPVSQAVMRLANDASGEAFKQVECALRGDIPQLKALVDASSRQREDSRFDTGVRYGAMARLPHAWLKRDGRRLSTLDLVGGRFVILAGPLANVGGGTLPDVVHVQGFEDPAFPAAAGFGETGALIVRPDGFVAWACERDASNEKLKSALAAAES